MRTVAVDILTGFLGSGKTTVLRHALDHGLRGKPVAVVMNEIGEIGIDGTVVTGLSTVEKMVELSSGCICCTIDDYRFDLAIQEIVDTVKPHLIVIESTGLADPEPLVGRVKQAGLGLDAVITVVDAANLARHLRESPVAAAQIEAADFVVVNKQDLVDATELARVERRIRRLNDRAERFRTVRGAVDSDLLFATGVAAYRERASSGQGPSDKHADGIASFVYRSPRPLRQEAFERLLRRLPTDVLRAKGLVRFAERDWQGLFNFTCGRHEITWLRLPEGAETQAVFIGRNLALHEPALRAALAACEVLDERSMEHA
ncbi:MAG TPA: GTP-binding protein [Candidatus Limnocylindria bacterium]|nr:GTP-binding protein [Candidatus Limnocylindria bacterium]